MRITVYRETANPVAGESGEQETLLRAVRLALGPLQPTEALWVERRRELNKAFPGKDCLLVVAPHITLRHCQLLERLTSPPVVVVTLEPRVAALELCRARIHAVVGPDAAKIKFAVRRAVASSTFERAARVAEEHPRLSPRLREWLARTLRRWPPYRSVKESVKPTARAPAAMAAAWRSEIGTSTPKEWLGRVQLARGFSIKGGDTWSSVAGELKITLRTLERLAHRLTSHPLYESEPRLADREKEFERYLAEILGGERA